METKLFDKTMAELREAFVRARFAEPKMFGRADITEWLEDPEWVGIIDCDKAPAIVRYAESFWNGPPSSTDLWQYATPYFGMNMDYLERVPREHQTIFAALRGALDSHSRAFFPWINDSHAYLVVIIACTVLRFEESPTAEGPVMTIGRANARDVLEIFNAEVKGARPKADAARAFMNRMALNAVASVRKSAECDFDEAVAVSADGTKIVKAKWVVVVHVERNGKAWLYPASAFRENKIRRRDSEFNRQDVRNLNDFEPKQFQAYNTTDPAESFLKDARHTLLRATLERKTYAQRLISIDDRVIKDFGSVLVANRYDCPSPLPVGGRELT